MKFASLEEAVAAYDMELFVVEDCSNRTKNLGKNELPSPDLIDRMERSAPHMAMASVEMINLALNADDIVTALTFTPNYTCAVQARAALLGLAFVERKIRPKMTKTGEDLSIRLEEHPGVEIWHNICTNKLCLLVGGIPREWWTGLTYRNLSEALAKI